MKLKEPCQREMNVRLESIKFYNENPMSLCMIINDDYLSYLTVEEAVELRDQLNRGISKAVGLDNE